MGVIVGLGLYYKLDKKPIERRNHLLSLRRRQHYMQHACSISSNTATSPAISVITIYGKHISYTSCRPISFMYNYQLRPYLEKYTVCVGNKENTLVQ